MKLQKWFVAAALANRYQEGVHTKQTSDRDDALKWLDSPGDENQPQWINELRVPLLTSATPEGAVGRLLRCLINLRKPTDPITEKAVGFRPGAVLSDKHHIWPTRFCNKYVTGWAQDDTSDLALNVTMISKETNIKWVNSNPSDQIVETVTAQGSETSMRKTFAAHFLDQTCIDIMRRSDKTKDDFNAFLSARQRLFFEEFEHWGIVEQGLTEQSEG
jgi:hypothetical protein